MKPAAKRRLICAGLFAALLFTEIMIGMYAHGFVREYIGDVLVMPAMYFFVRIFTGRSPRTLPLILFVTLIYLIIALLGKSGRSD